MRPTTTPRSKVLREQRARLVAEHRAADAKAEAQAARARASWQLLCLMRAEKAVREATAPHLELGVCRG